MRTRVLIVSLSLSWAGAGVALPAAALQLPAPAVQAGAQAADTVLDGVALVGLVVSPDGTRSSAVLRAAGGARVVGVGDTFFGARVAAIGPGRVTLEAGGRSRELRLSAAPESTPAPAPPSAAERAEEGRVFTRAEVERRIADETPRLLSETALIPVTEDGHVSGFTLSRVPEGSLLTDLGLRAGDVLTDINGTPIDSMATLLALYTRLQGASEIRATVLRGGSAVPLVVRLR